ncbi:unnamed protein product [Didymodactylos carnosus]|uniref:PDZ domain-containing protein n=1 Tax=Didymodactylos carnosus TaxID=1234261 RepID=A0A8S2SVG6_9BILA|nr:unnamed protein product [Didymodactylos carnosus]CAF4250010.1 unnamed protein product [Didymodactylos carnosus]
MPSYTVLNVKLQRDSASIPWGFRMIGGKDFGSPLQIQRVNPGSVAEKYGIKPNDYIVKILSTSTEHLKHQDAQDCIIRQQNNLELTVQRETVPDQNDYSSNSEFPPHELISPSQPKPNYQQQESQKPILEPELPVTNNQTLLTQVHNTPIGLYSADTVTNTLNQTLKNDDLHDSDYSSPSNLSTSSSYQSLARSTSNNSITNTVPNRGVNNIIKRLNNHPSNGTKSVEDLQSKYLSCEDKLKNETRQGPSFRALLKGLDNGREI